MQAEEVRAEADATVARAHAQASEMVAEAKGEAEQIVTRAYAQVVERRAREELTLEELRGQAEQELGAMRADTDAIAEERRRLVEEIRELAARLESVADSGAAGAAQEPGGVDAGAPPASGESSR